MNYKEKKQSLVAEFNKNQQTIQQLANKNQQILGQLQLLEELEKQENASLNSKIASKKEN